MSSCLRAGLPWLRREVNLPLPNRFITTWSIDYVLDVKSPAAFLPRRSLHQPIRSTIMPALAPCIKAALEAGAKGAFLSGAGECTSLSIRTCGNAPQNPAGCGCVLCSCDICCPISHSIYCMCTYVPHALYSIALAAGSSIMALTAGRKGDIYGQATRERRDIEVARAMQVWCCLYFYIQSMCFHVKGAPCRCGARCLIIPLSL